MTDRNDPHPLSGTHNDLSGSADNIIQAGHILGGVHFHSDRARQATVLRQLPPVPTHFTGRAAELARLEAILATSDASAQPTVVVSALAGAAGVGKTALAVHWAHTLRERFPDGDLYINLQGYDVGPPLSALQALEHFLLSLDVPPERIPQDLGARTSLYRTLVSRRRLIILLDNVRNAAQVRPLLPGTSPSFVLVTSRSQLSGLVVREGAQRIVIDSLAPEESIELLRSIIGRPRVDAEPAASAQLAGSCVHLPLALCIAAEQAVARPHLSIEALAAEVESGSSRLDALATNDDDETTAVREVFSWSYRNLSPTAARTFRLLGLPSGPEICVTATAALTGLTPTQAARVLAGLASSHLLETVGPDRYRIHDLLRDYAAERTLADDAEEDRAAALRRLLTWYLFAAEAAAAVLDVRRGAAPFDMTVGDRPDPALTIEFRSSRAATDWCEREFLNLLSACRQAAELGEDVVAWQLPIALRSFFQLRSPTTDWITSTEKGLAAARRLDDRAAEATVLRTLGAAHYYCGRYEESLQHNCEALAVCREIGEDEGWYLNSVGDALVSLGRFEEAIDCLRQALTASERNGDASLTAHTLENIAPAYRALGRDDKAIDSLQESLRIFRNLGRAYGEGLVLDKLAATHLSLGRFDEAVGCGRQALDLHTKVGNRLGEANTLRVLADAFKNMGQPLEARNHGQRALAILEGLGHRDAADVSLELCAVDGGSQQ
ncbi:tetratricopeptide repeat protein [Streptomyces sp. NBC_01481]|uniref:ATP-binding protein n=1 Tax=Streptomyces sp. NBC_01481 TaxID=2975869 RepID=UPI00224E6939|nr:tetratricopeptide repeat protein [Streptomyces sp. NBC_01481]MCX4587458.1 tetratricopeptide repeat protein [Streptomyces sp. NBC_01481]